MSWAFPSSGGMMFTYEGIAITWLGHDSYLIEKEPLRIYIDPFKIDNAKTASIVLITHEHFDHCSVEDLQKIVTPQTIIVCPHECMSQMSKIEPADVVLMAPGDTKTVAGVAVTAHPAYNLDKFRDPATKTPFHPPEDGKLGYVLDLGVKLYHAGDTDNIPELAKVHCDLALLPVSGTYVMTAEEAAAAAKVIKPKIAIPMHYGSIVGKEDDATKFKQLLEGTDIQVQILEKG